MTQALSKPNQQAITGLNYTPAQISLIKATIGKGLTDDELVMALAISEHTGLDPFARQIYFIRYGGKMTPVTGIDGYRAIASRTNAYAGSDEPVFDREDALPGSCRVTVYRVVQGLRCPFTGTARFSEFRNKNNPDLWDRMPRNMLAKAAEAQALRKAFPTELAKVAYTDAPPRVDPATGEILEGAWFATPAHLAAPAGIPAPSESQPGASNRLLLMCPDHDTDWYKKGSMRTFAHKEGDAWCNRPVILSRLMKEAREQAGVPEDEARDYYKATFGKPPSQLTDEQRVAAIEHFEGRMAAEQGSLGELPFDELPEPEGDGEGEPWPEGQEQLPL